MSLYGYGNGNNLINWDYYRVPADGRPLDYPAHLPWPPPPQVTTVDSSDAVSNYKAPVDNRSNYQKFYDYVDGNDKFFGVSDRTLTQGIGAFMPGGFIMANDTDRAYGVPNYSSGVGAWLTGTGIVGDWAENKLGEMKQGDAFQSRYGKNYFGPGSLYASNRGLTGKARQDAIDKFTGLTGDQSITEATRAGTHFTEDTVDYLNSLPQAQADHEMNTLGLSTLNAKGEAYARSKDDKEWGKHLKNENAEIDRLQAAVNKAQQAQGINSLAQNKNNFAQNTLGIPSAGRQLTQPTDLQNLGTTAVANTTEVGNIGTSGYGDNIGSTSSTAPVAVDPVTGYRTAPGVGYDSWTEYNPSTGERRTYHGSGYDWNNDSGGDTPAGPGLDGGYGDDSDDGGYGWGSDDADSW